MNQLSIFLGSLRYEFRMQIRRRPLWITFIVLGLFFTQFHIWNTPRIRTAADMVIFWTGVVQTYLAVAVGVLLADRLVRDRRTKVEELFNALPSTLSARILGKYLGCTLATLVPMFTVYTHGSVIFRLVLKIQHRAGHTAPATSPRVLRGAVATPTVV